MRRYSGSAAWRTCCAADSSAEQPAHHSVDEQTQSASDAHPRDIALAGATSTWQGDIHLAGRSGSSAEQPVDGAFEPSAEQPGFTITIVSAITGVHMMCAANVGPELKIGDLKCLLPDYAVDSSTVVAATRMRLFGDSVDELQDNEAVVPRNHQSRNITLKAIIEPRASSTVEGRQMMKCIAEQCLELGIKMEPLLETAALRRQLVLDRLRGSAAQPVVDTTHEITDKDMKDMYNDWRWDVDSWMIEDNLRIYHHLRRAGLSREAQQMGKKAFSAYMFELAGSKFLLHKLIQLPILAQCSAEQPASVQLPASLMNYINDLQEHKQTPEYKAAVERSQKRDDRGGGR